jgi:hypothetical protein
MKSPFQGRVRVRALRGRFRSRQETAWRSNKKHSLGVRLILEYAPIQTGIDKDIYLWYTIVALTRGAVLLRVRESRVIGP